MNARLIALGLVLAALVAGSALAQQPQQDTIAKLSDLEGNVLVSQGDAMVAATANQRVVAGTRVVTTSGAKVTVGYDVGCDVRLKENERFTVNIGPCGALVASVQPLGPAAGAIGGGTVAAGGTAAGVSAAGLGAFALGAGVSAAAYVVFRQDGNVSPN